MDSQRVVIGILCIDIAQKLKEKFKTSHSYISSSYSKIFECASVKVVPIWLDRDESYYRDIMKCINGIVLPGGAVFFDSSDSLGTELTNNFVLAMFGICLGFQFLLNHSAGADVRVSCEKLSEAMNAEPAEGFKNSKMFHELPTDLQMKMQTTKFAVHSHRYCITKEQLNLHGIADQWKITATNRHANGLEFISTVEHTKYPFYGTQFHPERSAEDAKWFVDYIVGFFISECSKNSNRFKSDVDMERHLIGNFKLETTGFEGILLKECYIFYKDIDYP